MLFGGRITVAAISIGIAQAAFDKAVKYSRDRTAFGHSLSEFQLTQAKLADMLSQINESRMLTMMAAYLKDQGRPFESEAAQAKVVATENALNVCDQSIQIHGGYGYADQVHVHRHRRDAPLVTIREGRYAIIRLIISRKNLRG